MTTLYLDLETRSSVNLPKTGVYIYADNPDTDVILACWAIDRGPIFTWYRTEPVPPVLRAALSDPACRVVAHNAAFERIMQRVLARYGWPEVDLGRWDDTMARARAMGLPASLDGALSAMNAPIAKDHDGKRLMMKMCRPFRINPDMTIVWHETPAQLARLAAYCAMDVQGERWLDRHLPQLTPDEREVWLADQRLNDRGVPIDTAFCDAAIQVAKQATLLLDREMRIITNGQVRAASNVSALGKWLVANDVVVHQVEEDDGDEDDDDDDEPKKVSLRKNDVERLLAGILPTAAIRRALEIRRDAGKSSVKKVDAMLRRVSPDGRVRGMLSYWGANTGRWSAAGSGIQMQNLPRVGVENWERAFAALKLGAETVDVLEGSPLDIISRMLRGAIKARGDRDLIYADLASVEARGVAWLAGQDDLVEAFRTGAKIYERMASRVFGVPETSIAKDSFERFIGKGLVLGAGYQMGAPKFMLTCAKAGQPVPEHVAVDGIQAYRETFAEIPNLWYGMQDAAIYAVRHPGRVSTSGCGRIQFQVWKGWLQMELPSGRRISYREPLVERDPKFDRDGVTYMGVDGLTKQWMRQRTYGGRLTENAVQGLCRDLIADGLIRL
jgi:DNA polymerase